MDFNQDDCERRRSFSPTHLTRQNMVGVKNDQRLLNFKWRSVELNVERCGSYVVRSAIQFRRNLGIEHAAFRQLRSQNLKRLKVPPCRCAPAPASAWNQTHSATVAVCVALCVKVNTWQPTYPWIRSCCRLPAPRNGAGHIWDATINFAKPLWISIRMIASVAGLSVQRT